MVLELWSGGLESMFTQCKYNMSKELHFFQGQMRNNIIVSTSKLDFHGVRPRSLWVLIARNPGEIRGRVFRVKS